MSEQYRGWRERADLNTESEIIETGRQGADFIRALYAPYERGWIEMRGLCPALREPYPHPGAMLNRQGTMWAVQRWYPLAETCLDPLALFLSHAGWLERDGYDVYVGVLPRGRHGQAKKSNIYEAGAAWTELDFDKQPRGEVGTMEMVTLADPDIIVRSGGGVHCVPLNTEILTPDGWKTHDEVSPGQVVMGYDIELGITKWTHMTGKVLKQQDDLVRVKNGFFTAVCTPDHRWVTRRGRADSKRGIGATEFIAARDIHHRNDHLVLSAPFMPFSNEILPISTQEASILGWIASDGSFDGDQTCRIAQSDKKFATDIDALLNDVPHTRSRQHINTSSFDMVTWRIKRSWFYDVLLRAGLGTNKHRCEWSRFVMRLSPNCRQAFLDAFWQGDGFLNRGCKVISQKPGKINDAVKLAIFLAGMTPRTSHYKNATGMMEVTRMGKPFTTWNLAVEPAGEGDVWCPQTETGTWVMKQGDTITITGNCYWTFCVPIALDTEGQRRFEKALRVKQGGMGADPVHDVTRILRLPGTTNGKYDPPRRVELIKCP